MILNTIEYSISDSFSNYIGSGFINEGKYSGEEFKIRVLLPFLLDLKSGKYDKVIINLDGTFGYSMSFLKESFGSLVRDGYITLDEFNKFFEFISEEEPSLVNQIYKYVNGD